MTVPVLTGVLSGRATGIPLLVGPALGTTTALWAGALPLLSADRPVLAWDLPGHGHSPNARLGFSVFDVATALLALADEQGYERFHIAGVSYSGAVALAIGLRSPERLVSLSPICALPRFGEPAMWVERAALARSDSTAALAAGAAERWFAPGFRTRRPELSDALLHTLGTVDDESYALCCESLADWDIGDRLGEIDVPLLAIAGSADVVTPPDAVSALAAATRSGRSALIKDVGHLATAERPQDVAALLNDFLAEHEK